MMGSSIVSAHVIMFIAIFTLSPTFVISVENAAASPMAPNKPHLSSNFMVLAQKRTMRQDPLHRFQLYQGGWDINNRSYLASTAFTALPSFAIAAAWFVGFGIVLFALIMYHCCFKHALTIKVHNISDKLTLGLLLLSSCTGIAGSIMLFQGDRMFRASLIHTGEYISDQAELTVDNLRNMTNYLTIAKSAGAQDFFLSKDLQFMIDDMNTKITSAANYIDAETKHNLNTIHKYVQNIVLFLAASSLIMLLLVSLGLIFSVLGQVPLVYIIVIAAWLSVSAAFILRGVFIVLNNGVGDTCVAMEEWVAHPKAKTSLDIVLPCLDTEIANESLANSNTIAKQMVELANLMIEALANSDFSLMNSVFYNQSGPFVPLLCNPYTFISNGSECNSGEVNLPDASEVWKSYTCDVSSTGVCVTTGRITPEQYTRLVEIANVSYALYRYSPFLTNMVDCVLLRNTVSTVYQKHCPEVLKHIRLVYIGLGFVSTATLISIMLWVLHGEYLRQKAYYQRLNTLSLQKEVSFSSSP